MHTPNTSPALAGPAQIPDYAHPVPVGADGLRFRKVHGPRTQASTERARRLRAEAARIMAARRRENVFTRSDYLNITP